MFKFSALISSLAQQLEMALFGLHLTSILKGLNLSTKIPQKISQKKVSFTLPGKMNILIGQDSYVLSFLAIFL